MCQMKTFASANFENRAVDSARAKRWASNQISPANWARAKMATATRAKDGLAIRVDAAHQRRSRATIVPIKTRTNRMLKDRAVLRLRYSANCVSGGISRQLFYAMMLPRIWTASRTFIGNPERITIISERQSL